MTAKCAHMSTTAPDAQGYVICCRCLQPLRRPLTERQVFGRIKG